MQTSFTLAQLADAAVAESERILRTCVHCGFCLATCPTYQLLGDELDSPRGRIYLIKDMLERDRPAPEPVVRHIDRCLSCLACMTTCPSGVHYMHLVDHARVHIERTARRPLPDRALRTLIAAVLPYPARMRWALRAAQLARPLGRLLPGPLGAMLRLAPRRIPPASPVDRPQTFAAEGTRRARVALLSGCAQQVLAPSINEASVRLLRRHSVEVVVAEGAGCCGALVHHMGREGEAHAFAASAILAWWRQTRDGGGAGLDAIVINASGCGTTIKDYGFVFRNDPVLAAKAAAVAALALDITELLDRIGLAPPAAPTGLAVAYHSACSMQHGQKITAPPRRLLEGAGFAVREVPEGHLCCGSAGTYNILQPELAGELARRKASHLESVGAACVATGNIGCIAQLAGATTLPVLHTVELLDWATGGPRPGALAAL